MAKKEQDRGNDTAATREAIEQGALRDGVQAAPAPLMPGALPPGGVVTPRTDEEGQQEAPDAEGLPMVLASAVDVVRDGKLVRIPAGTVVSEAEFDEDEWDTILRNAPPRQATFAEVRASEARKQSADSDRSALDAQRKQFGIKPSKKAGGVPQGAQVIVDLEASAEQTAQVRAAAATQQAARVQAAGANRGR